MARILRGEIYWADWNPVRGREQAGFPLTLELPAEMLPKPSWVKVSQIRTISVDRVGKRIAALGSDALGQLIDGLLELIG